MAEGCAIARDRSKALAGLWACAALLEAGFLGVFLLGRPASHVSDYLTYYLLLGVPYAIACWLITRIGSGLGTRLRTRWIWVAALVFRLTVLPLDPSLSEDTVRYRWQGLVQDAGGDPYLSLPSEERWEGLRDETWPRVAAKDSPSAYGPLLEQANLLFYRLAVRWDSDPWAQVWLFKLLYALPDLGVGVGLMALLAGLGRPKEWALIYLWSPLAVTEFWMEGHNDAIAVALVVTALALAAAGKRNTAVVAMSVATLCKFWPAVLIPFVALDRRDGRWHLEWRGVLASSVVAVSICAPYWDTVGHVRHILVGFAGEWQNNEGLFALIALMLKGNLALASAVAHGLMVAAIVVWRLACTSVVRGALGAVCTVLLLAANCFPWYLTWMLPLLAVRPVPPLLLWTALVGLAYHVIPSYESGGVWQYDRLLTALQYAPVLLWLAVIGFSRASTIRDALAAIAWSRVRGRAKRDGR